VPCPVLIDLYPSNVKDRGVNNNNNNGGLNGTNGGEDRVMVVGLMLWTMR